MRPRRARSFGVDSSPACRARTPAVRYSRRRLSWIGEGGSEPSCHDSFLVIWICRFTVPLAIGRSTSLRIYGVLRRLDFHLTSTKVPWLMTAMRACLSQVVPPEARTFHTDPRPGQIDCPFVIGLTATD